MNSNNTLSQLSKSSLKEWEEVFRKTSEKRVYLLGIVGAIIYPASIIDIGGVPKESINLFLATRIVPGLIILVTLLIQRLVRWNVKITYYILFVSIFTGATYRINDTDTSNFLLLNGMAFIMFAAVTTLKLKDALILASYGIFINILVFFWLYANTIPLGNSGILITIGLAIIYILLIKFRYDNSKRNFLTSIRLKEQNAKISKQKNDLVKLNEAVNQQNEEILSQRDAIEEKNKALSDALRYLEQKNKNITASINYASRIQAALLSIEQNIAHAIQEKFILFKPRDIVSGDFYWFYQKDDKLVIAALDCTGHGVPGAFMSMIGDSLLNLIVGNHGILDPAEILNEMNTGVGKLLNQDQTQNNDGMDVAICVVDQKMKELEFAGAKRPLIYFQNGKLLKIKGNKFSVGGRVRDTEKVYAKHTIDISDSTSIYLYSDGFVDQFGGKEKRKFMDKNFHALLTGIQHLSMVAQREILDVKLKSWMKAGDEKQVDDILVIGLKFN